MKNKKNVIIIISIILVAVLGGVVYALYFNKKDEAPTAEKRKEPIVVEEKQVQIFKGSDRPIAVMIDNNTNALPHAGLSKAYMVYEILVEGGETRLMALFKGQDLERIGPVRSSRHYFLDYALENDAIYVHYGWSPKAESDIDSLNVANINGLTDDDGFWRTSSKYAPHNAMTSTEDILKVAKRKDYRTTSQVNSVLKYSVDEVTLDSENAKIAEVVKIPFSPSNSVEWIYDSKTKTYVRYTRDIKEVEEDTEEEVTAKNIIIEFIRNNDLDDEGRQDLNNLGTHDGYYITNGKAIKITCEKTGRKSKTVYKDLNENEINVNDGNTFIQICPKEAEVEIDVNEEE